MELTEHKNNNNNNNNKINETAEKTHTETDENEKENLLYVIIVNVTENTKQNNHLSSFLTQYPMWTTLRPDRGYSHSKLNVTYTYVYEHYVHWIILPPS